VETPWSSAANRSEVAVWLDHSAPSPNAIRLDELFEHCCPYLLSLGHGYSTEGKPVSPAASPITIADSLELAG
jgi:hypothetical protein